MNTQTTNHLPIPPHFDPGAPRLARAISGAGRVRNWAKNITSTVAVDKTRICLLLIDVQNTFCIPGFELFVWTVRLWRGG